MSVLTVDDAKAQSRIDFDDDDSLVQSKLDAAESMAVQFMGRYFYKDQADLSTAIQSVPDILAQAKADADNMIATATGDTKCFFENAAVNLKRDANKEANMRINGIVLNPQIAAGVLLIFGYLYETREDVDDLPQAAKNVLQPFRVNLGV